MFTDHDLIPSYDLPGTIPFVLPPQPVASAPSADPGRDVSILGVRIRDVTRPQAAALIDDLIRRNDGRTRSVFFANAHTLNLAAADESYRAVLNGADQVFGDGTGVRWAARFRGIRLADNVNGTDLMPEFFRATNGCGYRCFLLGDEPATVARTAEHIRKEFPGWTVAGHHHGYLTDQVTTARVIRQINRAWPHVLLVGMGNPLQERWIYEHQQELKVPVAIGVGCLLRYLAGDARRAPLWLRRLGAEWLGVLFTQPHKARRYLIGSPQFLWRAWRAR